MLRNTTHPDVIPVVIVAVVTLSVQAALAFQKYRFNNGLLLGITLAAVDWYEDTARRKGLPQSRLASTLIAIGATALTLIVQQAAHLFALSHLLSALPQPVLAAVVLMAVAGLFQISALNHLWSASRPDFVVAMATLLGVLGSGLLRGVMIGAVISLVQLMRRASKPHVALLGRIPGTRRFSDLERHPDNEAVPGALILRPESSLIYFNIDYVCSTILERVCAESTPPGAVVLDLSASPYVDLQSADTLAGLVDELGSKGIRMQIVKARASVRERLRSEGLEARLSGINRFTSVEDALDALQKA